MLGVQALSTVGRCRSFDAAGDGYGRGEGFAVAVLCPSAGAAAPHTPLGLLCGSAVNQVGDLQLPVFSPMTLLAMFAPQCFVCHLRVLIRTQHTYEVPHDCLPCMHTGRPLQRADSAQRPLPERAHPHSTCGSGPQPLGSVCSQRARHGNAPGRSHRGRRAGPGPGQIRLCSAPAGHAAVQQVLLRPHRGRRRWVSSHAC